MQSPKEKKRYLSSTALLYALKINSFEAYEQIIINNVDLGKWKFVNIQSIVCHSYPGYINNAVSPEHSSKCPKWFQTEVVIHTSKPGVMIGHGGEEIEKLKKQLSKVAGENVQISIADIKKVDLNAQLVADNIANQITNRASFRMAQKRAIRNAMKAGAKGIKTSVSGRLGGADMARSEGYTEGTIPLHTLRADVDYATSEADTTFGKIGVKVWIYKGEILNKKAKGGN